MKNKLTMYLMVGLPRSGKSTYAKNHFKNAVIICPDRIRKLIFGHQFHIDAEDFVWAYAKGMAKLLMEQGKSVIIDATNLNTATRSQWYNLAYRYGAKIKVIWVTTSLTECRKRNKHGPRDVRVPDKILAGMHLMFKDPNSDKSIVGCENIEVVKIDTMEK